MWRGWRGLLGGLLRLLLREGVRGGMVWGGCVYIMMVSDVVGSGRIAENLFMMLLFVYLDMEVEC